MEIRTGTYLHLGLLCYITVSLLDQEKDIVFKLFYNFYGENEYYNEYLLKTSMKDPTGFPKLIQEFFSRMQVC